ncbi:MAG TPA: hypothetical protein PLP23_01270 [Panacibacter sp.]|nr:hypothetical protein [Panacibacter sp.]
MTQENLNPTPLEKVTEMRNEFERVIRGPSTLRLQQTFTDRVIEETQSAWVKKTDIDQLVNDNTADGIRMYFGVHTEETDTTDLNKSLKGKLTVILVATRDTTGSGAPTPETSADILLPGLSAPLPGEPVNFIGMAGDKIPLCPPIC